MKVAFRVDASPQIGMGHLMRCRNLAMELTRRGAEVSLLFRDCPPGLVGTMEDDGLRMVQLPNTANSQIEDAAQCVDVLGEGMDAVVVDHYHLGEQWEKRLRTTAKRIVAFDDMGSRRHDADVLIDQNFSLLPATRYQNLLPSHAQPLLGPRFACLSDEYRRERAITLRKSPRRLRLLIGFGGSDVGDVTGRALSALSDAEFADLEINVTVGGSYPYAAQLRDAVSRRPHTSLHVQLSSLAPLLESTDLAIGACGVSLWERFSFGVPSILVGTAANHLPINSDLDAAGLAVDLGPSEGLSATALKAAVRSLIDDTDRRLEMSLRGQLLVDGFGCLRISEVICPTALEDLRLRPAGPAHVGYLYELTNLPEVRAQSFSEAQIPWPDHEAWFQRKREDIDSEVWVLEANRLPVGQIRIDRRVGSDAILSYALDPIVRGRGWGHRLVALGIAAIRPHSAARIIAEVKPQNSASRAILLRLGFALRATADPGKLVFVRN